MLGPAFNGRYMSVDKPVEDNSIIAGGGDEGKSETSVCKV